MESVKEIAVTNDSQQWKPSLVLDGNPLTTRKRSIPKSERPKMYLKVRELLSTVTSDLAAEIIEGR